MDRMSSIELALKNERTEMEYYLNQAKRSHNKVAQALFYTLAEDEKEHMTRLEGLHAQLIARGFWPEDVAIEVAGTNIRQVLDNIVHDKATAAEHDDDDIQALKKGVEFERNGAQFYTDLAAACTNPAEAKFFRFLAGIEREHFLSIQSSLSFLTNPEGWFQEKERSGLDGA